MPSGKKRRFSDEQLIQMAKDMLENKYTLSECGKKYKATKSAMGYNMNAHLKDIDYDLYLKVKELLEYNLTNEVKSRTAIKRFDEVIVEPMVEDKLKEIGWIND